MDWNSSGSSFESRSLVYHPKRRHFLLALAEVLLIIISGVNELRANELLLGERGRLRLSRSEFFEPGVILRGRLDIEDGSMLLVDRAEATIPSRSGTTP